MDDETLPVPAKLARDSVAPAKAKPAYVKIEKAWKNHPADSVLLVADDLTALLDKDGVPYRDATDFERRVGGFPD